MNRFEDVFRPFLQGNAAQQLMRAPIHHIDAKREKRQITVELHPEQRIPLEEITRVDGGYSARAAQAGIPCQRHL